jgi:hypothetical protein
MAIGSVYGNGKVRIAFDSCQRSSSAGNYTSPHSAHWGSV